MFIGKTSTAVLIFVMMFLLFFRVCDGSWFPAFAWFHHLLYISRSCARIQRKTNCEGFFCFGDVLWVFRGASSPLQAKEQLRSGTELQRWKYQLSCVSWQKRFSFLAILITKTLAEFLTQGRRRFRENNYEKGWKYANWSTWRWVKNIPWISNNENI